mgnify:CR=1 FL=1
MATTSFETLLYEIASAINDLIPGLRANDVQLSGQCTTAGTVNSAIDTTNRFETADTLKNTIFRVADSTSDATNGQVSEVSTFDPDAHIITLKAALSAATDTATKYQLFRYFPPTVYKDAINEAIEWAWPSIYNPVRNEALTFTPGTYYQALPSTVFHVSKVEVQTNLGNSTFPFEDITGDTKVDWSGETGRLYHYGYYPAGATFRITGIGRLTAVSTDASTVEVSASRVLPIKLYAIHYMFSQMANPDTGVNPEAAMAKADKYLMKAESALMTKRMPWPRSARSPSTLYL